MTININDFLSTFNLGEAKQMEVEYPFLQLMGKTPVELQASSGNSLEFVIFLISSIEKPGSLEVDGLIGLAFLSYKHNISFAIVLVDDRKSDVIGLIMPNDVHDLGLSQQLGNISDKDLGLETTIVPPRVRTVIYGCKNFPAHPGYPYYQKGWPIPRECPIDHLPLEPIRD